MLGGIQKVVLLVMFCGLNLFSGVEAETLITNYHSIFIPFYDQHHHWEVAIRQYRLKDVDYFLCVDSDTLQTRVFPVTSLTDQNRYRKLDQTRYVQLLRQMKNPAHPIQNDGVVHIELDSCFRRNANDHGNDNVPVFLTIDMCPSIHLFDRALFRALVHESDRIHHPIPVGVAISGLWMIGHPADFHWLVKQQEEHKLEITWINHSFSHPYYPGIALEKNFLLSNTPSFEREVLDVEKELLQQNQFPSVFFRFPGLVSSEDLMERLSRLGLIALGTDAWLAKGQEPRSGSIILIHGNGNEPAGVLRFLSLLRTQKMTFLSLQNF